MWCGAGAGGARSGELREHLPSSKQCALALLQCQVDCSTTQSGGGSAHWFTCNTGHSAVLVLLLQRQADEAKAQMVEADGRHQKASRELEAERTRAHQLQVGPGCFV